MEIPLFSKYFCILLFSAFLITNSTLAHSHCLDDQKSLLLELRRELTFNFSLSTKLVTWNFTENCCLWTGVECDGEGHVISLQLDHETISGAIKESSILFNFRHLKRLNLAYNNFDCKIPSAIHNLTHLTHLNLSNAGFFGNAPLGLSLMTTLVSLDLNSHSYLYYFEYSWNNRIEIPNLKIILKNLSRLKELYLDGANISVEGGDWGYIISSTLPNLQILSLRQCGLSGPLHSSLVKLRSLSVIQLDLNNLSTTIPDFFANFSNLTTLTLRSCSLIGSFPQTIFQVPTLQVLDLSWNRNLSGTLPDFPKRTSLRSINLLNSRFSGSLKPLANLTELFFLDLSGNFFSGSIQSLFMLKKLTHVDLSSNKLTGSLSLVDFEGNSNLVHLDLSSNLLSGTIPLSLFCVPSLTVLRLNYNSFHGPINEFSTLYSSNLEEIDLSNNRLDGPIPVSLFKLKRLLKLDLSDNFLDGTNINSSLSVFTKLTQLSLRSCNLHNFPNLRNYSLTYLDLSYNHIAGEIPSWIWDGPLQFLYLSFNSLVGLQKPYHFPHSLLRLFLDSNKLQGSIPASLCNITDLYWLDLSNNSLSGIIPASLCNITDLFYLNLSNNSLSGKIPPCLFKHHSLGNLRLGTNKINGEIHDTFSSECSLYQLDLKQNNLEGKILASLANCKSLEFINVGNNKIEDKFPCMLPSSMRVLVMRFNKFHGEVRCYRSWPKLQVIDMASNNLSGNLHSMNFSSWTGMLQDNHEVFMDDFYYYVTLTSKAHELEYGKILYMFTTIDMSSNNFQGVIPNAVGDLRSLHNLNFSHNALIGTIPKSFGKLNHLESLDLSKNLLTGKIPTELASLTSLAVLNLSYNKIVGEIPLGHQFQTFSISSFLGNMGLCGFPLDRRCNDADENGANRGEGHSYEEEEIEWVYVSAALGFVAGFGSIFWLLFGCESISMKFSEKVEIVLEHMFINIPYRTRRLRRSVQGNQIRKQ